MGCKGLVSYETGYVDGVQVKWDGYMDGDNSKEVGIGNLSQVNRLKSNANANTRSTQMAVSNSNGGLGLPTEDIFETAACGIWVATRGDSSGGSRGDGDGKGSGTVVSGSPSLPTCATSASGVVSGESGAVVSVFKPPGVGSGKHSRFDFSQRGQNQFLDLGSERGVAGQ